MRCRFPSAGSLMTLLTAASIIAPGSPYFGLTGKEPLAVFSSPVLEEFGAGKVHLKQCDSLKLFRRQKRLCRREPGLAEGLREAIRLSALECRYQFRSERWNCSLEGRGSLIKRGFKETAFLFAISSAGLTHSLAKACSSGRMERCTCDESPDLENKEAWQWGGCGDNLKYSIKFIKHFLGQRKASKDLRARVDMHNTNVGIKAVKSGLKTTCKCHGVSGSCAVRTCWKQLSSFHETGKLLKLKYETAIRVHSVTNDATGETELISPKKHSYTLKNHIPRTTDLVYIEDSPSFCRPSKYSPGTAGRVCSKETNCESMCCGQGYNTQSLLVHRPCHCQVQWCCYVECQQCSQREEIYTCKH